MNLARGPWKTPVGERSDRDLVTQVLAGRTEAYGELVRRYQRPLMAKALASTRNVADADDMVQEAFTRAWANLAKCRDTEHFGAWLHRILANLLVDRSRRAWREVGVDEPMLEAQQADGDPEERALADELFASVRRALDNIPAGRQREVFRLRYAEGLPIDEIAKRLGVHSGTVKTHLFRTVKRLKERLGSKETVL